MLWWHCQPCFLCCFLPHVCFVMLVCVTCFWFVINIFFSFVEISSKVFGAKTVGEYEHLMFDGFVWKTLLHTGGVVGFKEKKKKDHLTLYCKVHTRHLSSNPAVSNSELFTLWCTLERRKFTSMFCSLYVCLSMLYNYHSLMPLTLHCLILEDDAFLKDAFCTNSRNRSRRDFTTHCTNMNKQKNPVGSVQ